MIVYKTIDKSSKSIIYVQIFCGTILNLYCVGTKDTKVYNLHMSFKVTNHNSFIKKLVYILDLKQDNIKY